MRYRKLTATGDYTFGQNGANFFVNTPEAVAQLVKTRLALSLGEWFLNTLNGTPYQSKILGAGRVATYDSAIQDVILNTQGVRAIAQYSSRVNPTTRHADVFAVVDTIYGKAAISTSI